MGTDELAGQPGSRMLFMPWGAESVTCAAALALDLRDETHARGLVVVDHLTVVPDELAAWPHRTLRTRTPVAGVDVNADVVVIIGPSSCPRQLSEQYARVRLRHRHGAGSGSGRRVRRGPRPR